MAKKVTKATVTVDISEVHQIECVAVNCIHNRTFADCDWSCNLKTVTINSDGQCADFKEENNV